MTANTVIRVLKTPVTLLLLLAVLGFGAYWGVTTLSQAGTTTDSNACVMTDVGKELTPDHVMLRVLNASKTGNLARLNAQYLRHYGFPVIKVNNASIMTEQTTIIGNAADSPEVKLAAQFFTNPKLQGDGRADHVVDVLVVKLDPLNNPATTVPVSGKICLPNPANYNLATTAADEGASASAIPSGSATKK